MSVTLLTLRTNLTIPNGTFLEPHLKEKTALLAKDAEAVGVFVISHW